MTSPLFPRNDNENPMISDRSARAKQKRGAVGEGPVLGSSPVSNTGVIILITEPEEITPLPESVFNLQGVSGSSYRFWRAPAFSEDKWEMVYCDVLPLETANPKAAGVDWLHIVFRTRSDQGAIDDLDRIFRDSLGFGLLDEQPMGRFNYDRQFLLEDGKTRFLIGGSHQRETAMLAIPGSALQYMDLEKVRGLGENVLKGWITRIDLCSDFYNGEYSVDDAMKDFKGGLYTIGAQTPKHRYIGPMEGLVNSSSDGRTLYIGDRKNGKLLRVYEKGKKQGIKTGDLSRWTRVELELHGSNPDAKNKRIIPWDSLARPGSYLAGGFKALEFISENYDRIKSVALKTATTMKKAVDHVRKVAGRLINALLDMGMNDYSIVQLLRGEGLPPYYEKKMYEEFGISVDEMREWFIKTFGQEQNFLLFPKF